VTEAFLVTVNGEEALDPLKKVVCANDAVTVALRGGPLTDRLAVATPLAFVVPFTDVPGEPDRVKVTVRPLSGALLWPSSSVAETGIVVFCGADDCAVTEIAVMLSIVTLRFVVLVSVLQPRPRKPSF
jgi:hypothetical protein